MQKINHQFQSQKDGEEHYQEHTSPKTNITSTTEQVKKIELTPDEWSIDGGHLTPTMKLKRKVISEKYSNLIDNMYN